MAILSGTAGQDYINGTADDDQIEALDGDDYVWAFAGNDTVSGGAGNDELTGNAGNDIIDGGAGKDIIGGGGDNDTAYGGLDDDTLGGGAGRDLLFGEAGADFLHGEAGNDSLYGGSGDDKLTGGADNDNLYGGPGQDLLLGGPGADNLYGSDGADILSGGIGDNLYGEAGDDVLNWDSEQVILYPYTGGADSLISGGDGYDTLRVNVDALYYTNPYLQEGFEIGPFVSNINLYHGLQGDGGTYIKLGNPTPEDVPGMSVDLKGIERIEVSGFSPLSYFNNDITSVEASGISSDANEILVTQTAEEALLTFGGNGATLQFNTLGVDDIGAIGGDTLEALESKIISLTGDSAYDPFQII